MASFFSKLQQHLDAALEDARREAAGPAAPTAADLLAEGEVLLAGGDARAAVAKLLAAEAAGALCAPVQRALAQAHLALGETEAFHLACGAWRHAVADDAAGLAAVAQSLLTAGHPDRAQAVLDEAVRRHPLHTDLHILLAQVAQRARRWPEALGHYEQALRLDPRAAAARAGMVRVCLKLQELQRAAAQLHYLRLLVPDYVPAFTLAAEIAERHGHWRTVIDELEPLIGLELADADALFRLGFAHWKLGSHALAVQYFSGCLAMDERRLDACFFLAQHAERNRQPERALAYYRQMAGHARYREWAQTAAARLEATITQVRESLAG